jgi:hypothetical protein
MGYWGLGVVEGSGVIAAEIAQSPEYGQQEK